jgi:AcrR family transcriptional regulator
MLDLTTTKGRLVSAALRLAGERPWADVTLADIAVAAQVSLVDRRRDFGSKGEILAAFVRAVDDEVVARAPERLADQPPRDALFEVVMRRFDVLAPYKPALKSIAEAWPADPALLRSLAASQAWMLRAAGIRPEGIDGQLRTSGLGVIYATVFRTWLVDDDPGLARTMAVLDRRLRRGERTLNTLDEIRSGLCSLASVFTNARKPAHRNDPAPAPDTPSAAQP